jgi:hypothetical protein
MLLRACRQPSRCGAWTLRAVSSQPGASVYAISSSPLRDICPDTMANPNYIRHLRPPSVCLHAISHAQLKSHVCIQQSMKNINHSIQSAVEHVIHSRKYTINQPPPLTVSTITPGVSCLASRDPTTSAISCRISPNIAFLIQPQPEEEQTKKDIGYSSIYKSVIIACSS